MKTFFSTALILILYSGGYFTLYEKGLIPLSPMMFYIIIVFVSIMFLCFNNIKYTDIDKSKLIVFLIWLLIYILLCIVSYIYSEQTPIQYVIFKNKIFMIIIVICCVPLIYVNISYVLKGMFYLEIISVMINISELLFPKLFYFSQSPGRSAGFYQNPNESAIYLIIGLILTILVVNEKKRLWYSLFVMIGVFSTFSRGGFILGTISIIGLCFMKYIKVNKLTIFFVVLISVLALTIMQLMLPPESIKLDKYLNKDALSRLGIYKREDPIKARLSLLDRGIELIIESPIYGHGLGATRSGSTKVSPHNMFIYLGVEQGVLGMLLYIYLLSYLIIKGIGITRLFGLVLFVTSWSSHNLLDYPETWIAIIIVISNIYLNKKEIIREN